MKKYSAKTIGHFPKSEVIYEIVSLQLVSVITLKSLMLLPSSFKINWKWLLQVNFVHVSWFYAFIPFNCL